MRNFTRNALAVSLLTFAASSAYAANTSFDVTATVDDACEVVAENLGFGTITPVDDIAFDGSSTITVTCSNGTAYQIGLNEGTYGTGVADRLMELADGTDTLQYGLYQDEVRTTVWGDTEDTDTVAATGNGGGQEHTVYGRIPAGQQTAATGAYSDTINVTVTY